MTATTPHTGAASSTTPAPVLDVVGLTKTFRVGGIRKRDVHAVTDAHFTVGQEQIVALVGESGSGKSTIARMIARLEKPSSGRMIVNGRDVLREEPRSASRAYRRTVQMIFQDPFGSLNPAHTVGYSVSRPIQVHSISAQARSEVEGLLETVGLNPGRDYADKYPHELSGGQRQRVAIARALASQPSLILADEPTSMLDVSIRMGVLNLLERLRDERHLSYLYITHDLASARYISDEILVMYRGHLVEGGATEDVIAAPAHPYTQRLLAAVPNPRASAHPLVDEAETIDLFGACPFAMAQGDRDICAQERTPRHHLSPGHWIRCSFFGSGTASAGSTLNDQGGSR